jgi:hypothetical protein
MILNTATIKKKVGISINQSRHLTENPPTVLNSIVDLIEANLNPEYIIDILVQVLIHS